MIRGNVRAMVRLVQRHWFRWAALLERRLHTASTTSARCICRSTSAPREVRYPLNARSTGVRRAANASNERSFCQQVIQQLAPTMDFCLGHWRAHSRPTRAHLSSRRRRCLSRGKDRTEPLRRFVSRIFDHPTTCLPWRGQNAHKYTLLIDRDMVSWDGSTCDKIGTSYTPFRFVLANGSAVPTLCPQLPVRVLPAILWVVSAPPTRGLPQSRCGCDRGWQDPAVFSLCLLRR